MTRSCSFRLCHFRSLTVTNCLVLGVYRDFGKSKGAPQKMPLFRYKLVVFMLSGAEDGI